MPKDSAILPEYIQIGIHADHLDMTKFSTAEDPGFIAVCGELCQWIKQLRGAATPGTPSPLGGLDGLQSNIPICTYVYITLLTKLIDNSCLIIVQSWVV